MDQRGTAKAARSRARGYRNAETFKAIIYLLAGRLPFELPVVAHHAPETARNQRRTWADL